MLILQDLSYYSCIQVTGPQEFILSRLSRLTDPSAGEYLVFLVCFFKTVTSGFLLLLVSNFIHPVVRLVRAICQVFEDLQQNCLNFQGQRLHLVAA